VTAQGVSAFPAEVTHQMVANFAAGGAAINQLARAAGAELSVVPLEVERPTGDFTQEAAMDESEFLKAVSAGYAVVADDADLACFGEMGIGNTTTAAAVAAALFGGDTAKWVGRGTGVDDAGLKRKAYAVDRAIALHKDAIGDPLAVLARLGGREIAAMLGAIIAARAQKIPVIVDGFVATSAAAIAHAVNPESIDHCLFGHVSAEHAHANALQAMGKPALLSLGMRLGEGSGAALAAVMVKTALHLHNNMATFESAAVSGKEG
jgi:nicotinate-nucleotide--dimethylbenzimidazole phosphoribosyltransferase